MLHSEAILLTVLATSAAAGLSWVFAAYSSKLAWKFGAIDQPAGGRKIHTMPVPLWGGLGIAAAMFVALAAISIGGLLAQPTLRPMQIVGFAVGLLLLLVGGLIDDRHPLPPHVQILFPIAAAIVVIATGTGIVQITNPSAHGGMSLVWWSGYGVSFPSDLLTFAWLLVATYTTKILDGLDGLVCGLAAIGAGLVGALCLSATYFLPGVALLSGVVGGSFLGFLPSNKFPAKQFLGESGALMAGFSIGVLAILSSAKVAIALAVLAIPIADLVLVVLGRVRRGQPWFKGDDTHLHFRLLRAGVSQRSAVLFYWFAAFVAGFAALSARTMWKIGLVAFLFVLTVAASRWAGHVVRERRGEEEVS